MERQGLLWRKQADHAHADQPATGVVPAGIQVKPKLAPLVGVKFAGRYSMTLMAKPNRQTQSPVDFKLELTRRPRRLRRSASLRALVRETQLKAADLIQPLFLLPGNDGQEAIDSLPGVYRLALDPIVEECHSCWDCGLRAVAVFPCVTPSEKDPSGSAALREDSFLLQAVRRIKKELPDLVVITDVALDPFTSHGHDGVLSPDGRTVDNDATVGILCRQAVLQAQSGVDWVAPSDMMDGRVGAIRLALDEAGFHGTGILAYSVKFASAYYGPFRDAVGSAKAAGTTLLGKETYQMDPANRREAIVEAQLDEEEGADILMVKPAGPYLDVLREVRESTLLPVAAYQVSGEYAQIHAAARLGWLDLRRCRDESLLAIKRAGADLILTYFARAWVEEQTHRS